MCGCVSLSPDARWVCVRAPVVRQEEEKIWKIIQPVEELEEKDAIKTICFALLWVVGCLYLHSNAPLGFIALIFSPRTW